MKNTIIFFAVLLCSSLTAQQEITVGVTVDDQSSLLSEELNRMLYNRIQRGLARHGVGANESAMLSILAAVDAGELTMTNTAPARYVRTYFVELQLTNLLGGEVFATYNEDVTVGKRSEREGARVAISSLAFRGEKFQKFIGQAKTEIGNYYRDNCEVVLAKAKRQLAIGDYINGLQTLSAVPAASVDCSQAATELIPAAFSEYERVACGRQVAYAEALVAAEKFEPALYQLLTIPDPSRCQDRFVAVVERIESVRQQLRDDAMTRLLLVSKIEADQTERRRRFLENMAFVKSRPCCTGVNEQGRIIIVE